MRNRLNTERALGPSFQKQCRHLALVVLAFFLLRARSANAWVFPEHEDIAAKAVAGLNAAQREALSRMWSAARETNNGLCGLIDGRGRSTECIDFSVLPALAGDHACSPRELSETVSKGWSRRVLGVSDRLRRDLRDSKTTEARVGIWELSHVRMQRVDADYIGRAEGSKAHFLLPREADAFEPYLASVLSPQSEVNAIGLYVIYHLAALKFAAVSSQQSLSADERHDYGQRAVWSEAFALHFLEDVFSAGHVVGNWGGSAWAKGTHDYYSEHGVDVFNWNGKGHRAFGDAFLTSADLKVSSAAVRTSLLQVIQAANGEASLLEILAPVSLRQAERYEATLACGLQQMPQSVPPPGVVDFLSPLVRQTPRATLGPTEVHLPRFRAELGPYVGVAGGFQGGLAFGGYDSPRREIPRGTFGLFYALRVGWGLEGISSRTLDGEVFLQIGTLLERGQLDLPPWLPRLKNPPEDWRDNTALPRVPSREGTEFRLRLPFYLIPGDTLLLAPLLYLISTDALAHVAANAAGGGLIPWQRRLTTRFGDFQVILGREVALTIYDWGKGTTFIRLEEDPPAFQAQTLRLDLPVIEWKPVRSFQSSLTSAILFQVGAAIDYSNKSLGKALSVYVRFAFDTRFYIGTQLGSAMPDTQHVWSPHQQGH